MFFYHKCVIISVKQSHNLRIINNIMKYGFIKTAVCLRQDNDTSADICRTVIRAHAAGVQLLLFSPSTHVRRDTEKIIEKLSSATRGRDIVVFYPTALQIGGAVYLSTVTIGSGMVLGVHLSDIPTADGSAYFPPYPLQTADMKIADFIAPAGSDIVYTQDETTVGISSSVLTDMKKLCALGINILICPLFGSVQVDTTEFSKTIGAACGCAVVTATEQIAVIAETGEALAVGSDALTVCDIDVLGAIYQKTMRPQPLPAASFSDVPIRIKRDFEHLTRTFNKTPLALGSEEKCTRMLDRCAENTVKLCGCLKFAALELCDSAACALALSIFRRITDNYGFKAQDVVCFADQSAETATQLAKLYGFSMKVHHGGECFNTQPFTALTETARIALQCRSPHPSVLAGIYDTQVRELLHVVFSHASAEAAPLIHKLLQQENNRDRVLRDFVIHAAINRGYTGAKLLFVARHVFHDEFSASTIREICSMTNESVTNQSPHFSNRLPSG